MTNQTQHDQISSYVDQIDMLFKLMESDKSNSNESLYPSASPSGLHRSQAPSPTKCFFVRRCGGGGCGGGGNGGKVAVDIINSVGNMTANIINSAAGAAAVVLPPVASTVTNIVGDWLNPGRQQTPQNPVIVYPSGGGGYQQPPPPPGQWVMSPNGQWVWVPTGQKPPPPPPGPPGPANATANATAYGGKAVASATAYLYPPSPTRSRMPQIMDHQGSPALTRSPATFSKEVSLDSHPAIQEGYQDICKTLKEMDKCADNILLKLG